jgi:NACalpha-BTF3-like transcription factor
MSPTKAMGTITRDKITAIKSLQEKKGDVAAALDKLI